MAIEYSRNKLNEIALQIMYSFLVKNNINQPIDFENTLSEICECEYSEIDIYLKELLIYSLKYKKEAEENLSKYLVNWTFDRLSKTSQAILILSYVNYYYVKTNPKSVIIDVAVNLAKKYGNEKEFKFINGVLDKALN